MLNLDRDNTRSHRIDEEPNEESGGSTKRSRTSEEGEYVVHSNQETPNSSGSTIQRPIGRDGAKKKGKGKTSQSFSFPNNEFAKELRAMRITRESEIEVMNKRLEVDKKREEREIKREERELKQEERELKKEERKTKKLYLSHLNALLTKDHVSPEEEDMKRNIFRMRKHLFLCIVDAVTANDRYFQQRPDATDEYLKMSGAVTRKSLMSFVQGVISCLGDEYLRRPNENDLTRLLYLGEQRGFP
nr:fgenesh protein 73 [Tanacetum cinerariifolium]